MKENLYKMQLLLLEFVKTFCYSAAFLSFGCFLFFFFFLFTFEFESQKVIFCDVLLLPIYNANKGVCETCGAFFKVYELVQFE